MKWFLLMFLGWLATDGRLAAQDTSKCIDVVYIRGGSVYRGRLLEHRPDTQLAIRTWNGLVLSFPGKSVRRVVQKCPESQHVRSTAPFEFREAGLYNATRLAVLPGQAHAGSDVLGVSLQHSIGWTLHRLLGLGVGAGVELYEPAGEDITTYPVFAEIRGYWKPTFFTPFYTLAAGWGFRGRSHRQIDSWNADGRVYDWQGGWMAKAQIGYRIGNHFTLYTGLSFQHKSRTWSIPWDNDLRTDQLLYKRLELGLGMLL